MRQIYEFMKNHSNWTKLFGKSINLLEIPKIGKSYAANILI